MKTIDKVIYQEIVAEVKEQLDLSRGLKDEEIQEIIDRVILEKSRQTYVDTHTKLLMSNKLFNTLRRLDALQPFLADEDVTEIMVNGKDNIFIEKNGRVISTDCKFESRERLEDVIQNIVSKVNRVVNESSPICDARLIDGSRVNVILPPVAINGPILTIRKFLKQMLTMEQLIEWGTISYEAAIFLQKLVKAKYNLFISGSTGSGKTTLLNILSNYIPTDERIITIEDSAELQISGVKNVVSLETRNSNLEGSGEIYIKELIRASLRMRPDRIIVGEVRGKEALDMLQAMNTGHDGSISTGHANSTKDMLSRLETMILSGENIPIEAIRRQIASSIDIMIHLGRVRDKTRKVLEISEVIGYNGQEVVLNQLFVFEESNKSTINMVIGKLMTTNQEMIHKDKLLLAGIK